MKIHNTLPRLCTRLLPLCLLLAANALYASQPPTLEQSVLACKDQADDAARLKCFDDIQISTQVAAAPADADVHEKPARSAYLERKWRLNPKDSDRDIADFETYKSNYLLVSKTQSMNDTPSSPTHPNTVSNHWNSEDLKFQFSLKTELWQDIPLVRELPLVEDSRLWVAYTQQSYWQFFNAGISRPFRENDYEPEVILSLGLKHGDSDLLLPRMLNLGLVHQSNGNSNQLSRSWNRIYLQGGWELSPHTTLLVRPWWRIPENHNSDDNPDIQKYLGYGDASIRWEGDDNKNAATLLLRDNLRSENKGYAQLDLQHSLSKNNQVSAHLSLSTGYGDSLLDYNHATTVLGLGISIGD